MLIIRARTSGGVVPLDVNTFTFPGGELHVTAEVWRDGKLLVDESLATIRARLRGEQ